MRVLGINAVFHDPAARARHRRARRGRGGGGALQPPQARQAAGAVLGLGAAGAVGRLVPASRPGCDAGRPRRRRLLVRPGADAGPPRRSGSTTPGTAAHAYATARAAVPGRRALPGLDPATVRFVPHHVAHAASAGLAPPAPTCARARPRRPRRGGLATWPAATAAGELEVLAGQALPHSLGPDVRGRSPRTWASCAPATSTR